MFRSRLFLCALLMLPAAQLSSCIRFQPGCDLSLSSECGQLANFLFSAGAACFSQRIVGGTVQGCPLNLSATVSTFAGPAPGCYATCPNGSTDGSGTTVRFANSRGIVTNDGIDFYIVDQGTARVRRLNALSGAVVTFSTGGINQATGLAIDANYIYVTDGGDHQIVRIPISTAVPADWVSSPGTGVADGTSTGGVFFNTPYGPTLHNGVLYVADNANHKIRAINTTTATTSTLAGTASGAAGAQGDADGSGAAARFNGPSAIATDGTYLYIADSNNHKIRRMTIATAEVATLAGPGAGCYPGCPSGAVDGPASSARFNSPTGLVTEGFYLYVGDGGNHRIRRIDLATGNVTTLAGGTPGDADGVASSASFNLPYAGASDGRSLFWTDFQNYKIRRIE